MDEDDSLVPIVQVTDEESLEKLFQSIDSCSFDIFKLKNEDLPKLVERIFKNLNMFEIFPIDIRKFRTFVNFIMAQYHWHVYYHNFRHACDVVHAVYLLVNCLGGAEKLNHLEMLALLIAALCHDVDHPGLTNSFLVASDDPLAVRYNDTAVLESHHASLTIKALTGYESTNLLSIFGDSEQRHIRKLMVNCILATDMGQHGAIMNSLTSRLSDDRPFESSNKYEYVGSISQDAPRTHLPVPDTTNDAMLLLKMLIKCADISNIVKPFFLSKRWAALLALEWFHQGDLEKQLGIPVSKNMDRDQPSTFRSMSIGCIDYIGKWMYERTSVLLPLLHDEIYPNLFENRLKWTRFMFSKPFEEEMEDILGPVFPPSARQRKVSNLPEVMEHSVTELPGRGPTMLQQMKNSHALSAGKKIRERPLSLLFGAPADSNTAISTLETPWNAALRHSSVKVNVRPSPIEHDRLSWLESHDRIQYPERGSSLLSVTEEDSDSSQEGLSETTSMNAHIEGFWAKFKVAGSALRLNEAFNSRIWTCWIMIPAMLIAMFADDFVKAFLPKEFDLPTRIIYIICIVLFALDLVALSILDETYLFSLCFWLDFVGTLSLIPFVLHAFRRNFIVARVWKIAEYLCRATKKLEKAKFYNIFQAGRLLKLMQHSGAAWKPRKPWQEFLHSKPSHIWLRLSELTSQKLVLAVLSLTIALPYFYKHPKDLAPLLVLGQIDYSPFYSVRFNSSIEKIESFNDAFGYRLVYLGVKMGCKVNPNWNGSCTGFNQADPYLQVIPSPDIQPNARTKVVKEYRDEEVSIVISESQRSEGIYSKRGYNQKDHILNVSTPDLQKLREGVGENL